MNRQEIVALREYKVVKHNDLIQKARYQLTRQEQKVLLYLISKIKPEDVDFNYQEFSIADFCDICGIQDRSGGNYAAIKATIKNLADISHWVIEEDGSEVLMRWIEKVRINKKSGVIKIRLDHDMKPYLLQLNEKFTQYELLYTLAMKSQYSVRLYELLRSYEYKQQWAFDIDELKRLLSAENYTRYPDFKRYVLDRSIREINEFSDVAVIYEPIKAGRKYIKIAFSIKQKKELGERMQTWKKIDEILNPAQMSLFEQI